MNVNSNRVYFFFIVMGFLIVNLVVVDFGVGMFCILFIVVYFEFGFNWLFGVVMCKFFFVFMFCFVMGLVGIMLVILIGKLIIYNILYLIII